MKFSLTLVFTAAAIIPAATNAAPVTGWVVVNPSTGAATTKPLFNQSTASPILGNGTEDSAATVALYASISGPADGAPDISLANGQQVTLSGFATMTGIDSSMEQFRWGLFQESSVPINAINWSGLMASNSSNSGGGALRAKAAGDGTTFAQSGSAVTIQSSQDGDEFIDETYHFSMTVSRFNDEVSVDASLTSADDWTQVWNDAIAAPPTPVTFDFNRVGFLSGGSMHANQISFSNIDVTTAPIDALTLRVFTAGPYAGNIQIRNNRPGSFEIEFYDITSAGSLNFEDWSSLDDQEGNDEEFEGWEESAGNDSRLLSEYRLFSTLNLAPSATLSMGNGFDVGSPEDLKFFVGLSDGTYLRGVVEYVSDGLTGDFNRDNTVDAADYVVWRKNDGTPAVYDTWRTNFGEPGDSGSGASANGTIPEPTTLALLMFAAAGWRLRRGRAA